MNKSQKLIWGGFGGVLILIAGISYIGYTRLTTLSKQVDELNLQFSSTTGLIQHNLADATNSLQSAIAQQQSRLGGVQNQVESVTGTLTDIQKLSKIDPQLLAKYSKVYFLNENYAPARLIEIPSTYAYDETKHLQIIPQVLPRLEDLINNAKSDGVTLYVDSAYRSFATQQALKGQYTVTYGAGTANSFSADQGYSEHQLGTAVDFITTGLGGQLDRFDKTAAYTWLQKNAYKYGFVLSYPKNNSYYIFEPWHWRYVGVKLATTLHESNTYFYSMGQRTIDSYLIYLFD